MPLESLKLDNFRDRCVYEIGLNAIREVSSPFGEEPGTCARNAWCRGSSKGFRLFAFPANNERRQLWNSTVNRYIDFVLGTEFSDYDRRTGDNETRPENLCRQFARPRKVSVSDSLDRLATASERTASIYTI